MNIINTPNQDINSFKNTFLSNMYPCVIYYENIRYQCTEAVYQAYKTLNADLRIPFQNMNGFAAKAQGRYLELRPDWDRIKLDLMEELLRRKFTPRTPLAARLLATGSGQLTEGNYWHDNFWGDCTCQACNLKQGGNNLGKLLMKIRAELQEKTNEQ